MKIYQTNSKK